MSGTGQLLGVILAGGRARRMGGGDKGLLMLRGQSLLERVIARLAPQVGEVILNANGDPARLTQLGLEVVADPVDGHAGPLAGVLAGLRAGQARGVSRIVTVAADTPFFPTDLVARLVAAADAADAPIALAATAEPDGPRLHPTFGLWPVALADALETALAVGTRKVLDFTDRHRAVAAVFPAEGEPFFNINRPEDLARAEALLERAGAG